MSKREKIFFTTIAARLERAIHADVGMYGLEVLLSGWQNHRKRRGLGWINFMQRAKDAGVDERFLFLDELITFSNYAGYDLTK